MVLTGFGEVMLPECFCNMVGAVSQFEAVEATEVPSRVLGRLKNGVGVVLYGPYPYVDGIYRYCQRFEKELAPWELFCGIENRFERTAAMAAYRKQRLHRLFVVAEDEALLRVTETPPIDGWTQWLEEPFPGQRILLPVRRLQRIITDMRRMTEGLWIEALSHTITVLPHVYVPSDQSVVNMVASKDSVLMGKRVLDMGTGSGVLALLAARLGATEVVTTDANPNAVENARLNVKRLAMEDVVRVCGPSDLFEGLSGEVFDVILFNAPWVQGKATTLYDRAIYDEGYALIGRFFASVGEHLAWDGRILLQYSNISDLKGEGAMAHLAGVIAGAGLEIGDVCQVRRRSRMLGGWETVFLFDMGRGRSRGGVDDSAG
ncbi:MAG: 50S ribosomal protein L11 methyltransferase [Candidatus Latescibacterota bacterium]